MFMLCGTVKKERHDQPIDILGNDKRGKSVKGVRFFGKNKTDPYFRRNHLIAQPGKQTHNVDLRTALR